MNSLSRIIFLMSLLVIAGCSGAPPDALTMLTNLSNSYPAIWRLVTSTAYVLGFLFAFKAVYDLRAYGEGRTMMSSQSSMKGPLISFLVAAALIYSPQMFATLMLTTFGYSSPLQYGGGIPGWADASGKALIGLIQVIGVIAFIRGWLQIAKLAGHSSQPGTFGKGLTHIIGGILAINIIGTKEVLWGTFGFS